jgi:hypothetical protein
MVCQLLVFAVPEFRRLIAKLSPRRPVFSPGAVHVIFVVEKLLLWQIFLQEHRFFRESYYSANSPCPSVTWGPFEVAVR